MIVRAANTKEIIMAKKINLLGQKFEKLTPIFYDSGYWNCICDCGNKTIVSTTHLISGNTKSCGCLKVNASKNNVKYAIKANRKYKPHIASARRLWKSYCYQDKLCTLTFDEWFNISQQNCFYCGNRPSNIYNYFLTKNISSQYAKDNGSFTYNGLDRIDNLLPHISNNVVACCLICNCAKCDYSLNDFYKYINTLKNIDFIKPQVLLKLPETYILHSLKMAYRHYVVNYKTMEIDLQTFYTYSQLPCTYCGAQNTNCCNPYLNDKKASQIAKENSNFYYNGIDRIDPSKTHAIDNIVPCCIRCNFAKNNLTLEQFHDWIKRIQEYQKEKAQKLICA
jgi:hypothetical protein